MTRIVEIYLQLFRIQIDLFNMLRGGKILIRVNKKDKEITEHTSIKGEFKIEVKVMISYYNKIVKKNYTMTTVMRCTYLYIILKQRLINLQRRYMTSTSIKYTKDKLI